MKKPAKPFLSYPKSAFGFQILALSLLTGVLVDVHATPIDIAGSYTTGNININSTLGKSGTVEASVKLIASGPIAYNYAFQFDLDVGTPAFNGPGDTFTVNPWLVNTQASLAASQNVTYTNDFTFLLDVPNGVLGIPNQVGFSNITIPRFPPNAPIEIEGTPFVFLKGAGTINNLGSGYNDKYLGRGYVDASGSFTEQGGSERAWSAGGLDLLDLVGAGVPGFSLTPTIAIDILRKDQAWLVDYEFTDPLQFTIPDNLNIGDVFNFSVDTNLKYDLSFVSFFAYEGDLLLKFNIPDWIPGLPDAYDITLANVGKWDVAVLTSELDDLLLPVTISGSVILGEVPEACKRLTGPFYASCLIHVAHQEPLDEAMRQPPEYPMPAGDRTFEVAEVPEPNGLALLAIGLLGMTWMRRRQLQAGAIAATFAGMAALGLSAGVQATPLSADIVVLVDESASMVGRHAWLSSMSDSLEPQLYNAGVTGPNHYGLVGFNSDDAVADHGFSGSSSTGINGGYSHLHPLHPGSPATYYGTAQEFSTGVGGLITSGSVGVNNADGAYAYKAINYALGIGGAVGQFWRQGSAHNLILVADWNKEDSDSTLYFPTETRDALLTTNTILNAVIDVDIRCADGTGAMGVDAAGTGYVANANGAYTTCSGAHVLETTNIIWSYADLALAVGGAVWDLSILDDGIFEYLADFTQAFVDVKVGEIADVDDGDNGNNGGDNGNNNTVPEPESFALLGIGLIGLVVVRRASNKSRL